MGIKFENATTRDLRAPGHLDPGVADILWPCSGAFGLFVLVTPGGGGGSGREAGAIASSQLVRLGTTELPIPSLYLEYSPESGLVRLAQN